MGSLMAMATLAAAGAVEAADACGAQVSVRQVATTPNADGTRTVRYRATVQTDQTSCTRVTFTIMRSYIKTDGTAFEDAIPVDVQVEGRADVEADTVADTRRLIYWRAERVTCEPCASGTKATGTTAAPAASAGRRSAGRTDDAGLEKPKAGKKAALIAGGVAVAVGGAVLVGGGGGGSSDPVGTNNPNATPRPTSAAPTTAPTTAPTVAPPTPTPEPTPKVFPGAPPAAPTDSVNGELVLVSSDPPAGNPIAATRGTIALQIRLYADKVGTDNRLELQFWSGGQMCLQDTSAALDIKAQQPYLIQFPMPNNRRCSAPFRTTLIRVLLTDRGTPKIAEDFLTGFDFVP
jgi:hypothetical protein